MLRTKHPLADRQCPLVKGSRGGEVTGGVEQARQVVYALGGVGMIRAKAGLGHSHGPSPKTNEMSRPSLVEYLYAQLFEPVDVTFDPKRQPEMGGFNQRCDCAVGDIARGGDCGTSSEVLEKRFDRCFSHVGRQRLTDRLGDEIVDGQIAVGRLVTKDKSARRSNWSSGSAVPNVLTTCCESRAVEALGHRKPSSVASRGAP